MRAFAEIGSEIVSREIDPSPSGPAGGAPDGYRVERGAAGPGRRAPLRNYGRSGAEQGLDSPAGTEK